jgi:uncharacterized protein YgiB involved in biofilm formation
MSSTPSKIKRTRRLALTTLMATASVNLVACDSAAPDAVTWNDDFNRPAATSEVANEGVDALTYSDLNACKAADQVPDADCDTGWQTAQNDHVANGPRFNEKAACEAEYGEGNCETRASSGGGSFFMPLLAGMVLGQVLSPGRGYGYSGTGLYRDRYGRFGTPYSRYGGGGLYRSPTTGRLQVGRNALAPSAGYGGSRYAPSGYARGGSGYSQPGSVREPTRTVSRGGFRSSSRGGYGG